MANQNNSVKNSKEKISEAAAILNSLLTSPDACSSVASALTEQTSAVRRNDTVDIELASLFRAGAASRSSAAGSTEGRGPSSEVPAAPRFQAQQCFRSWTSNKRRRPKVVQYHETFHKDVILLPNPLWEVICKPVLKHILYENGHILSAFEFHKSWDQHTVLQEIRDGFGSKIPQGISLQILMGLGQNLVFPKLQEGQELTGQLIQKVFKSKALYLRPSQTLLEGVGGSDDVTVYQPSPCTTRAMAKMKPPTPAENVIYDNNPQNLEELPLENHHPSLPDPSKTSTNLTDLAPSAANIIHVVTNADPALTSTIASVTATSSLNRDETVAHTSSNYTNYLSVMSSMSDLSSDDEEMNHAILASLQSHISEMPPKNLHVKDILQELAESINTGMHSKFNICRSAILDGAMRGFKRISYNPHFSMNVKFSDDLGKNEEAVDLGGPRREFLRLLIEALSCSPMFEGPVESKNLAMNSTALREDQYFMAGRAIAVSLVHGGPAPHFLSRVLFDCLVGGPNAACPTLADITDADLQEKLKKVSQSSTFEEFLSSTNPLLDYMINAGCVRPLTSIGDRDLLLHDMLMFHVVHRVQGPFQRFQEGLKTLGVLDVIKQHPDSFLPLLCHHPSGLTADMMDDLFTPRLSPKGSNKRRTEEAIVPLWRDYLQDAEDEEGPLKLQNILVFATGASEIPPLGFSPAPSIEFLHDDSQEYSTKLMFPMANTCINCLKLPLITSYKVFKEKMDFALGNTQGFGRT